MKKVIIIKDCTTTKDCFELVKLKHGEMHELGEFIACKLISDGDAVIYKNDLQLEMVRAAAPEPKYCFAQEVMEQSRQLIRAKLQEAYGV